MSPAQGPSLALRRAQSAGAVVYAAQTASLFLPLYGLVRLGAAPGWTAAAYPLVSGLALMPVGWLSSRLGRRQTAVASLLILALGEALSAAAIGAGLGPGWLAASGALAGLGSGGGAAFAWSVELSDIDERGKRAGAVAAAAGVAAALGLPLGGALGRFWAPGPFALAALIALGCVPWVARAYALPLRSDCPPPPIRVSLRFGFSSREVRWLIAVALLALAACGAERGLLALGSPAETLPFGLGLALLGMVGLARVADAGHALLSLGLALGVAGAAALVPGAPSWIPAGLALAGLSLAFVATPTALVASAPEMLRPLGFLFTQVAALVGLGVGLALPIGGVAARVVSLALILAGLGVLAALSPRRRLARQA